MSAAAGDRITFELPLLSAFEWRTPILRKPLDALEDVVDIDKLKEVASRLAVNKTVIFTLATSEYRNTTRLWLRAMQALSLENYIVISGDEETSFWLKQIKVQHIKANLSYGDTTHTNSVGFSGKALAICALKFPVCRLLLRSGLNVIFSDIDAIWLRNPINILMSSSSDLAFQGAAFFPQNISRLWGFTACTGFFFIRHSSGALQFMEYCVNKHMKVHDDQFAFNLGLLAGSVRWRNLPNAPFDSEELVKETFKNLAGQFIRGRLERCRIETCALPHHQFWRHPWAATRSDHVVVCHPNSGKSDQEKIQTFVSLIPHARVVQAVTGCPSIHPGGTRAR